jgi:hypothetical protein
MDPITQTLLDLQGKQAVLHVGTVHGITGTVGDVDSTYQAVYVHHSDGSTSQVRITAVVSIHSKEL